MEGEAHARSHAACDIARLRHQLDAYQTPMIGADIVAAIDDAGVGRTALWGYSRGARLAAMVASEFPDRVAAFIVGGADLVTPADPEIPRRPTPLPGGRAGYLATR